MFWIIILWCGAFLGISNSVEAFIHQPIKAVASDYTQRRDQLVLDEKLLMIGSQIQLNANERKVDAYLKRIKHIEFEDGIRNPDQFAPSLHFFKARALIERSPVYRMLRRMPKGALLHGHNSAMVASDWLIRNLTYRPDILKCERADGQVIFTFRQAIWHQCNSPYVRVTEERAQALDPVQYDATLEKHINMFTDQPQIDYPDINVAWRRFEKMFVSVSEMLGFEQTFAIVYTKMLQDLYDDRIMYVEMRTSFTTIYYEDGRSSTKADVVRAWRQLIQDFQLMHSGFVGVKFIYAVSRNTDTDVDVVFQQYRMLKAEFPEMIVGFDLVGQEDVGKPLLQFVEHIDRYKDITFFFHAGETDLSGYSSDRNLFDAILLNATRIGHGYALYKHPVLLQLAKQRRICLEVCPISNQVLGLVHDLRNHPATVFTAINVPMVISSDDPGFWGVVGLSYDFYYALMSFSSIDSGLAYAKQLALNSLEFSRLTAEERPQVMQAFNLRWKAFIELTINLERL